MTRPVKIVVAFAVVAGLSALVVLTRPGPGGFGPGTDRVPEPTRDVPPPATDDSETKAPPSEDTATEVVTASDTGGEDAGGAAEDAAVNPASADGHGPNDVVRTRDAAFEKGRKGARPVYEPNWDAPTTLTFARLRKYRREYKQDGDFSDETVRELSGAAVVIKGAVMPIDPLPKSGEMKRLWIANPMVVMAGCVFCTPPTLADIVYVKAPADEPYEANRERLYRSVVIAEARGRLTLGPRKTKDGVEYMFGLELIEISD
ncbi:MAG: hypothetical protein JRF63_09405 [Deltaproteobacteria bacterium]|nr:hypothetical protein [Deltaproteobacteria bacterium]